MKRREFVRSSAALAAFASLGGDWVRGNMINKASAASHLHVPPEEAPHELTFMQWPVNRQVHPDQEFLDILQGTIADTANSISEFEPVILCAAKEDQRRAKTLLSSNVELWDIPTEDLWARDSGPLFAIQNDELVISHIQFNGWGNNQVHMRDGEIAAQIAHRLGVPLVSSGLQGEVGGVEHDGHGLLMAHESSWVNDNRNRGLSRDEVEARLLAAYGATRMIWAQGVKGEDITDYHIDSLARFTGAGRVLINLPDELDEDDPFHMAALETYEALEAANLDVEVIPEPEVRRVDSVDFVASYANYYACNGAVIAAQFGDDETDKIAADALARHYPNREIITLNVDALGEVGGGIHCATQQMPKVVVKT
ncbi:agmatine deiminase family protein [Lentilitoribacter sp. EG35]|uniref:agmatine deiminase family protein n=1 Tax=Lentilitoribacter sp. EG35 TaxID=3234192 RepID=UPI00346158B3